MAQAIETRPDDWKRIGPGVYVDAAGAMHILDAELLAANGYADTPANRATVREAARRAFRELGGVAKEGAPIRISRSSW